MIDAGMVPEKQEAVTARAEDLFTQHRNRICCQTDRLFAGLLMFQWLAGIAVALILSPRTWSGAASSIHPHVLAAIFLGGSLSIFPLLLVWSRPGTTLNRHVIAVAQMLSSSLLIQITGGRAETHFHVFGSLAFLSFYRDWTVLVTASAVTGLDHVIRGIYWPISLYGRVLTSPWSSLEHVGWVVFNDVFLVWSCVRSKAEMMTIAIREARNAHLLYQAQHDALTGLPNRLLFSTTIDAGIAAARTSGRRLALLCLDLDRFKQINDTLGHQVGDVLLQEVGKRLSARLDEKGTLVRMGGDEFAVILQSIGSAEESREIATGLLECLKAPFNIALQDLYIGASIGISVYPDSAEDAKDLQKKADIAMYRVKSGGKNGVELFSKEFACSTVKRMGLEHQLRQAIVREEFTVLYQPQVTLEGKLRGFEALVRWDHPNLGRILPSNFISVAEETSLISPIGDLVMRRACLQAAEWQKRFGKNLSIAVNVSSRQFTDPEFTASVAECLRDSGLSPKLLEIELTESLLMADIDMAAPRIKQLQLSGVRFAMDNFGTGYSSLNYLRKLPVDVLKIDRSFIAEIQTERSTLALVESMFEIGRTLGIIVIAEGVEQQEQVEVLKNLGCVLAQGFLFGKPVPVDQAEALIYRMDTSRSEVNAEECFA